MLPSPCTQPGCPELVAGGGRCKLHHSRRPVDKRIYDSRRWKNLRVWIIACEPLCRECKKHGRVTLAEEVDHIEPISFGGDPWDETNLQPLCGPCHSRKTVNEMRVRITG